jgi:hypothetical protein
VIDVLQNYRGFENKVARREEVEDGYCDKRDAVEELRPPTARASSSLGSKSRSTPSHMHYSLTFRLDIILESGMMVAVLGQMGLRSERKSDHPAKRTATLCIGVPVYYRRL